MSPGSVVALAVGVPLLTCLLVATGDAIWRGRAPWPYLAVAAVVTTNLHISLSAGIGGSGPPDWGVGLAFLAWATALLTYPDGAVRPRWMALPLLVLVAAVTVRMLTGRSFQTALWGVVLLGAVLIGGATQIWRYHRRSSTAEREAVQWALVGVVPALTFLLGLELVIATTTITERLQDQPWVMIASHAAFWLVPCAAVVGLLRPRRPGADRAVLVVLVISGTVLVLIEVYLLLQPRVGPGWAALVVSTVQVPMLLACRAAATVLVYGGSARPVLASLGDRLQETIGPDDVPGTVAEAVRSALHVPYAAVELAGAGVAEVGERPSALVATVESFRVEYHGRPVASIEAAPRSSERGLSGRDRAILRRLAARAGPALHGAVVVAELRGARQELLLAREDERRRLRRDLHDDLAPTLAGLAMRAAAVATLTRRDPPRAGAVVATLEEGIRGAADQVRQIAYGLRPPLLDDHGLVAALEERLRHDDGWASTPTVTVTAGPDLDELPAAVELAVLRIAQESVANARRHAHATRCDVSLLRRDGHLRLQVVDDGRGFTAGVRAGIGLRSITERSAELGGTSRLTSGPSGTTVEVYLPLGSPA